jgi:hypothetical protein
MGHLTPTDDLARRAVMGGDGARGAAIETAQCARRFPMGQQPTEPNNMNALGIVYSIEVGRRNKLGTQWPVENMVRRVGRTYYLDRRVCNGICEGGTTQFRTKRRAIEAANL